ncbi:hypothetical protein IFM89_010317 [Coptis chinensis]|uniref:RNase H type-1 domain-containing protein n=1 Tax=Coptis chinensis TaxID=261450 RepID=A0A835HU33_9MAGN|nr:hypothetical protein IFM89_010317 [Coptis chinensis]
MTMSARDNGEPNEKFSRRAQMVTYFIDMLNVIWQARNKWKFKKISSSHESILNFLRIGRRLPLKKIQLFVWNQLKLGPKILPRLVHLLAESELKREEVDRIKFMNLVLENTLEMNGNDKNDIGIVVIKGIDTMHQRRRQKPTLGAGYIIDDIRHLFSFFEDVSLIHVYRESNSTADILASYGIVIATNMCCRVGIVDRQISFVKNLYLDSMGVSTPRLV